MWGFILVAHSWVATNTGGSVYSITGFGQSLQYVDIKCIYRGGTGVDISAVPNSTDALYITFYDINGGGYGIIPMIY